jgi:hypothetical protein
MFILAERVGLPFFYACDETRAVARAYNNTICPPDFFGGSADVIPRYRGKSDVSQGNPMLAQVRHGVARAEPLFSQLSAPDGGRWSASLSSSVRQGGDKQSFNSPKGREKY